MTRLLAVLTALLLILPSFALAGAEVYIANPNPSDRLHLRTEPYAHSQSLGKYYNGAPVERTGAFNANGWVQVKVGMGAAVLKGFMSERFLTSKPQASAMPQYVAVKVLRCYQQPDTKAVSSRIPGGSLLSLMGFSDGWWHMLVHSNTSEGNWACFAPSGAKELVAVDDAGSVAAGISNPDATDRLHLRAAPDKNAKSLGKYYNGTVAALLGFTADGEWLKVSLYGKTGYMMRDFVCVEGQVNRTYYGIPTVKALRQTALYQDDTLNHTLKTLASGSEVEILGLINERVLHVRQGELIGYVRWADIDYTDPKK